MEVVVICNFVMGMVNGRYLWDPTSGTPDGYEHSEKFYGVIEPLTCPGFSGEGEGGNPVADLEPGNFALAVEIGLNVKISHSTGKQFTHPLQGTC